MKRSSSNETDIPINAGLELRIQMQSVSSSPGWKVSYIQTPMNIQVSPDSRPQTQSHSVFYPNKYLLLQCGVVKADKYANQ